MLAVKIILIVTFGSILFQDLKERRVYWFLFPAVALLCGWLQYKNGLPELFAVTLAINLGFVLSLLTITFIYALVCIKRSFRELIGAGDVLLFIALTCSFASVSFIILFVGALVAALIIHKLLSTDTTTVPLAGYMSGFFGLAYLGHWTGFADTLYRF